MRRLTAQLALHLTAATRTDGELLASFVTTGAEADFAELVRRHGPMVWGVCRRALPDFADAEDAFQAVFLVLLRRANRLTSSPTIGPWLHRVAVWTARNVRRRNARRLARRVPLSDQLAAASRDPNLPIDLDAALLSLPDKYRSPVVLCHLLGYSRAEAASRLGCPEGTLSAWLSRGLAKLRAKLGGLDPAKALALAAVSVPTGLSASVVRTAVASQVSAAATSTVSQIVEGVLHMFWVKKATAATVALFAVFALGMGVGLTARHGVGVAVAQVKPADAPPATPPGKAGDKSPAKAPKQPTLDEQIETVRTELRAMLAGLDAAREGMKLYEELTAAREKKGGITPAERANDQITLARFKETEREAARRVQELNARLANLKREHEEVQRRADKQPPAKDPRDLVKEFDKLLHESTKRQAEIRKLIADAIEQKDSADRTLEKLKAQATELAAEHVELVKRHQDLMKKPEAKAGAYLELTLHGKGRNFEFAIEETDAAGKEIGTAVVREPAMLAKLLARVHNDPAAPKQLRVVADPSLATNGYFVVGLKACETAGFKTVKFTGYMPQNLFLQELKSDQKGDAAGFKRYDAAERDTASLIKEFEDWMRTW